jgi:hypothetical protein
MKKNFFVQAQVRANTPPYNLTQRSLPRGAVDKHPTTQDENTNNNCDACYNRHNQTILGLDASHTKGTTPSQGPGKGKINSNSAKKGRMRTLSL